MRGPNGLVYQSGMGVGRKGTTKRRQPTGGIYRAMVITTTPTDNADENPDGHQVLCDLIMLRSNIPFVNVPVAEWVGVNDAKTWNPKPTTGTVSGDDLVLPRVFSKRGSFEGEATPTDDLNGDVVLVQFVEGDIDFPLITGRMAHELTKRKVVAGTGWTNDDPTGVAQRGKPQLEEYYQRFGGTEIRINKEGDLLLDMSGATSDLDTEAPSPTGGEMRIRLKDTTRLTVASPLGGDILEVYFDPTALPPQVKIDLGKDADQRLIMGDKFKTYFLAHTHLGVTTGPGVSGVPVEPQPGGIFDDNLSELARTKEGIKTP